MDVDSVTRIDAELAQDIQEVAATFGWQTNWLNDNAAMFKPNGIDYDRSAVLYENEVLRVIGPHVDDVFIMKLYAARQVDIPDLVVLWPQVTFQTGSDVVDRYNDAYPAAFHDEYLIEFVQLIIGQASSK